MFHFLKLETLRTSVPIATVKSGRRIVNKKRVQSDLDDEDPSDLGGSAAPSKRARLDDCKSRLSSALDV